MTELSREDVSQLYMNCLVEHDGRLGFCRDIVTQEDVIKLAICYIGDRTNTLITPDPDKIWCPTTPYRLGYVQLTEDACTYLTRSPRRQYAVGWSEHNVSGFNVAHLRRMGTRLLDNLSGVYPTFKEAYEKVQTTGGRVAFDRMFAIGSDSIISYKGQSVCYFRDGVADLENHGKGDLRPLLNKAMGV